MATKLDDSSRNGRPSGSSPPNCGVTSLPQRVAHSDPASRRCLFCTEYSTHMSHRGVVYRILRDASGGYHRYIAYCPDLGLRERSRLVH